MNSYQITFCDNKHVNQIDNYCITCNILICPNCRTNNHSLHNVQIYKFFLKIYKSKIENAIDLSNDILQEFNDFKNLKNKIEVSCIEYFDKAITSITDQIRSIKKEVLSNIEKNFELIKINEEKQKVQQFQNKMKSYLENFTLDFKKADINLILTKIQEIQIEKQETTLSKFSAENLSISKDLNQFCINLNEKPLNTHFKLYYNPFEIPQIKLSNIEFHNFERFIGTEITPRIMKELDVLQKLNLNEYNLIDLQIDKNNCRHIIVKFKGPEKTPYESRICLDVLKDKWSPALQIRTLIIIIPLMLSDPNFDDPVNCEASELWKKSKIEFEKKYLFLNIHRAREITKKYAV